MKRFTLLVVGISVGLLPLVSGCAYFVRKECQSTDWRHTGYEEGAAGAKQSAFRSHQQRCGEVEVAIPVAEWKAGWVDGHRAYCSESGGLSAGSAGLGYTGVCQGESAAAFERGYLAGLASYCPQAGMEEGENGSAYTPGVCAVTPQLEASYRYAFQRAIRRFCQPASGWNHGLAGRSYGGSCPDDLEPRFLEFYRAGEKARSLKSRIVSRQQERDSHEEAMLRKMEQGYDARWEREHMRDAERDVLELTRQLTVVEARYQRW